MKEVILVKYGELALKGLNRPSFETRLLRTIRKRVALAGEFKVYKAQSTVYIEPESDLSDIEKAFELCLRIFGLAAASRALATQKNIDIISNDACEYLKQVLESAETFKVSCKRSDKSFSMTSMEAAAAVGRQIADKYPHLSASMKNPDCEVVIEIRDYAAYIHKGSVKAAGGMPTGTSGRAAALLSGGIDSPVAAYMMAKRGMDIVGIHFMSPPYTGEQALDKVRELARRLSLYAGNIPLFCVPFTDIQTEMLRNCPEQLLTVLMRRSMMRIAQIISVKETCKALITGESLAQVASQTLDAVCCTDRAVEMPVFRPLIGMDKAEITETARKIGTYDISILPFEDCCTVFTPKHPKIKPEINEILNAEQKYGYLSLESEAVLNAQVEVMHFFDSNNPAR